MTEGEALAGAARRLRAAGIEDPRREAGRLLALVTGRTLPEPPAPLTPDQALRFETALAARCLRQPFAQISGEREFWGRSFRVTRDVLDPRPDTESLIEIALAAPAPARLLDLGTGSGIIAITLLGEWPAARALATDLSPSALAVAAENAARHGVAPRLTLQQADWWTGITGEFDLILSNPPYIAEAEIAGLAPEVREWEPRHALTPGPTGLEAHAAILAGLDRFLAPGGRALFEIGATQGGEVAGRLAATGLGPVVLHPDINGRDRVAELRRRG